MSDSCVYLMYRWNKLNNKDALLEHCLDFSETWSQHLNVYISKSKNNISIILIFL